MSPPILTVTFFGNPSIYVGDAPVTGLPSSKVAALAYYLFATGRTHGRDTLAGLLWPDYGTAQAKKNLRGALYHLRNALDDYLVVSRQDAGPVDAPIQVDARHFEQLLQQATGHPANSPEQISCLRQAMAHHHGSFLEGFHTDNAEPFEEWARGERERFAQMAGQTLNTLVIYGLETGDFLQGIQDASQLLILDPLREETHRHLMTMLAMDGQQNAALTQYERCAELLNAELGMEPDSTTVALAARIRNGEFSPSLQLHLPPPKRHNLPAELAPFMGREAELQQILRALSTPSGRLITLVGVGGIGKSRLAIHTGRQLIESIDMIDGGGEPLPWAQAAAEAANDGVYFVRLASIEADEQNESRIIGAIAAALQIELVGDGAMIEQIIRPLQGRRLLLILDNFEQLQPRAGLLVDLLERVHELRIIVTSRTRLNLRGEQVIILDGLPGPEAGDTRALLAHPATALFVSTATAISPGFMLDAATSPAIVHACRLLQGLPLGIELAASWTRLLSCDEITQELQQGLDFLSGNMPDLPARHRSLRAVFNHTWAMLETTEKEALRRLAIFRGSFTRQAAASVARAQLPELSALMDNSVVKRVEIELESGQLCTRYELPEILRQYAMEELISVEEFHAIAAAHADYYAAYVAAIEADFHGGDQISALEQVTIELEDLRTAWDWACESRDSPTAAIAKTALNYLSRCQQSFFDFHDIRGWFEEGERIFRQAVEAASQVTSALQSEAELLLPRLQARQAWFLFHLGQPELSERLLLTSLAKQQALNANAETVFNLSYLGALKRHTGEFNAARTHLLQAHEIAQDAGDQYGASVALNILGQVAWLQGDLDATVDYCQQALALKRTIGDRRGMIYSLTYLGRAAEARTEYNEARSYLTESLRIAEALDDPRGTAQAQQNLANLAYAQGDLTMARRLYERCLELYRHSGSRIESTTVLTRLGEVATDRGEYAVAAGNLQSALEAGILIRSKPALLTGLLGMAQLLVAQMRLDDAGQILTVIGQYDDLDEDQRNRYQQLVTAIGADQGGDVQSSDVQSHVDELQTGVDTLIACALKFTMPRSPTPSPTT